MERIEILNLTEYISGDGKMMTLMGMIKTETGGFTDSVEHEYNIDA